MSRKSRACGSSPHRLFLQWALTLAAWQHSRQGCVLSKISLVALCSFIHSSLNLFPWISAPPPLNLQFLPSPSAFSLSVFPITIFFVPIFWFLHPHINKTHFTGFLFLEHCKLKQIWEGLFISFPLCFPFLLSSSFSDRILQSYLVCSRAKLAYRTSRKTLILLPAHQKS